MYKIRKLTKELAIKHQKQITKLLQLIPLVEYLEEDILVENKLGRKLLAKWDHSLIVFHPAQKEPIAVLIAYERKAEDNNLYPINTLYLNEICVLPNYQGIGIASSLLKTFINNGIRTGYKKLKGKVVFAVQTNSSSWNSKVQGLYIKYGFKKTGEKVYSNRTDNIYMMKPE